MEEAEGAAAPSDFAALWDSLSPGEQSRMIELLVEQVAFDGDGGIIFSTFRPSGIKTLAGELVERREEAA